MNRFILPLIVIAGLTVGLYPGLTPVPEDPRTTYGADHEMGEGFVRSFVSFDSYGAPVAFGVEIDELALQGLPHHAEPPAFEHEMHLPDGIAIAPFDHISIDWVPHGHEPHGIYDKPHFDFHFYMISVAERDLIVPSDEAFMEKGARAPEPQYMPAGYIAPPGNMAVPRMGAHLADLSSPEFRGEPFTSTFIWGSYDGVVSFMEPMVTREFLLSLKEQPDRFVRPIPQPEAYQKAGHFPHSYALEYDADRQVFRLTLEDLHLVEL